MLLASLCSVHSCVEWCQWKTQNHTSSCDHKVKGKFPFHFQKQFCSCLHAIHTFKHPATTQPTNFCTMESILYSAFILLKVSLNSQWFIPFDLMKLTSYETNVKTFIIWRDFTHTFPWCIKQWNVITWFVVLFTYIVMREDMPLFLPTIYLVFHHQSS